MTIRHLRLHCALVIAFALSTISLPAEAAKVVSVGVIDKDYLIVNISDGIVEHEMPGEKVTHYTPELNTTAAVATTSWTIKSSQDTNYGTGGKNPAACSRKKKLSGHAQGAWVSSDYAYEYTYEHWIYLKLPTSLQQGATYTLAIAPATNVDTASKEFTFDVYNLRSEAVHVNLVGYAPDAPHKGADLYAWLGDGGSRDYSAFVNNKVYVYDVAAKQATEVGKVALWKPSGADVGGYNLTRSTVWNADFSSLTAPGTYRLVVDGVGCSEDFQVAQGIYGDPFKITIRGFFYMRLGQDNSANLSPPPRTPLYIPSKDPASTKVYLTTMQLFDPGWSAFASGGDPWDRPNDWAKYRTAGNPTNNNAYGGHADAADKDRHLGHISIIYDMLLPFILTKGAIADDNAGIAESGNGIPDIIDEARYEVDFWLRLRDGKEYGHGLTNPNSANEFFQAGTSPVAAWANAANAAMLADAFRIAGNKTLADQYTAAAVEAYGVASAAADPMLDKTMDAGGAILRGRDLKMTAAAYLYNVTGDAAYEDAVKTESVCTTASSEIFNTTRNQLWATAGYLMTPRAVHYQPLWDNMKASVISQAKAVETSRMDSRPSRRSTNESDGYFRTIQNVHYSLVAHAITSDATDKALFRKALALEADWGLGRNPANLIEMGVSTTPLASKRGVKYMYTAGVDDGVQGTTPGQTPYCNLDDWDTSMTMGSPSKLYANAYPANFKTTWPIGEDCFETPWVWAHSEFTPQQTMRGKTALYGYLYGIAPGAPSGTGGTGTGGTGALTTGGSAMTGGRASTGTSTDAASGGLATAGGATSTGGNATAGGVVSTNTGGVGGSTGTGDVTTTGGIAGAAGASTAGTIGAIAGSSGSSESVKDSSGCGCRVTGTAPSKRFTGLFALALVSALLRRRRMVESTCLERELSNIA